MLPRILSPRSLRLTVVALFLLPPAIYYLARGGAIRTASAQTTPSNFRNFESPQVHPLALTPDGTRLLAVNTPDDRLSVFELSTGTPVLVDEIPVYVLPVLLGDGIRFSPQGLPRIDLEPVSTTRSRTVTILRFRVRK